MGFYKLYKYLCFFNILRDPEIETDHTPIMLTIPTNTIKIKTAIRDNYNLDWQFFQIHTSKWEYVELNGKQTQEIDKTTRKLIQHLT